MNLLKMSFTRRLSYFLVHSLKYTNKEAKQLILDNAVKIDGVVVNENVLLPESTEIKVNESIVRAAKKHVYYKFNKPPGYECTFNEKVPDNLNQFFQPHDDLIVAGRLDKASEGLLLVSNDGKWVERICHPKFRKTKEYLVTLDKQPSEVFLTAFRSGTRVGSYITQPCYCERVDDATLHVKLTEGKNRQIRRMCYNLGYNATRLVRIAIDNVLLGDLAPGEKMVLEV